MGVMLAQPQQLPGTPGTTGLRTVALSRAEAEMMVRVVEGVIKFSQDFPVEFLSYCPSDRWKPVLEKAGQGVHAMESQLSTNAQNILVSVETLTAIVDLEECASGARDKRLSAGKLALIIAAGGIFAQSFLGLTYVATPAYIAALAISLGKPLIESQKEPVEPFKPSIRGTGLKWPTRLGDHTDKAKVIERVIVPGHIRTHRYHWGTVTPTLLSGHSGICLVKGEWRVRIEGWGSDRITVTDGWRLATREECVSARNEIAVWDPEDLRDTGFGKIPLYSGHEETFWVEYGGSFTEGHFRRAGPFG